MVDYFIKIDFNVFVQVGLFLLLLVYLFTHRKDPHHLMSGVSLFRTLVLVTLFLYLLLNYASEIPPGLRSASIFGMFLINLYMLWNAVLTRLERPYRVALEACAQTPGNMDVLKGAWQAGKRFFSVRYFLKALFSGGSVRRFLNNLASHQVREDLTHIFKKEGIHKDFISLKTLVTYLKKQLAQDETLPQEFKGTMDKVVADFAGHPWIEDQVNQFLNLLLASPEVLFYPEWAAGQEEVGKTQGPAAGG